MKNILLSRLILPFSCVVVALALLNGCGESQHADSHGHPHDQGGGHSHGDDHAPPHGGTPVLVAADEFHLELVLNVPAARVQAYVLDGHLESYIPVAETNFLLIANMGGKEEQLDFRRAPEPGSDNTTGKSSVFEAQADWLRSGMKFEGHIPAITFNGKQFTNITFSFPKGSKHVH